MKLERFNKLNLFYKIAIISFVVLLVIEAILSFLFFIGYSEVPLGIALGSLVSIICYLLTGIVDSKKRRNTNMVILVIFLRLLICAGLIVLTAILYYRLDFKYFNVLATAGGFLLPLATLCLYLLINRRKEV